MLGNQMTACILASPEPEPHQQQMMIVKRNSSREDKLQRKIFVGNVIDHPEITSVKLFKFFSKYGEIAEGPHGFDKKTGKPVGFAIFVYKTVEGARKALENPIKNFYGHPLYCERANGASGSSNEQKSGFNGLTRNLHLKNDDCNSVGSSPRGGAGFDSQIGVIGRRVFVDQGDIDGGSGITKLKSGSKWDINGGRSGSNKLKSGSTRNLSLKNDGGSPQAGDGAGFSAQNGVMSRRVLQHQ
ncbi:UBP1-associated protein 2B-like [Papaver somniferum]|uniref:UBP1-associated protein 2B-like n=1 Tax=Papaver somniferum TaxID=3469 RepID=UPI000E702828|nr:UBP1-associated protein 2B-like [Papaver somniferum]